MENLELDDLATYKEMMMAHNQIAAAGGSAYHQDYYEEEEEEEEEYWNPYLDWDKLLRQFSQLKVSYLLSHIQMNILC